MIDGSQFLTEIRNRDPHLGLLLEQIINGVNGNGQHTQVNPLGMVDPPDPLEAVSVKAAGGDVHVTLTHNAPMSKNIRYFVEASTTPDFAQPHVIDLGSSRGTFTRLPALDDGGMPQNWHFRGYAQYQGSNPSKPTYFGTMLDPTPVSVGGTTQLTPLPSKGSGTAKADGTQGGKGLGVVLNRPAITTLIPPAPRANGL
jgi:hypothetical protein